LSGGKREFVLAVTGSGENEESVDEQDVLSEVNAHVHEAARRFEGIEPGPDRWDFTCECGAPDCRVTVSLTTAEYEALQTAHQHVLAPGHVAHT
jgi:hypothetical protein